MKGLRTQENEKFNNFFTVVQNAAEQLGFVFFLDAGDGHDKTTADMEMEDLFGWLIPIQQAEEFDTLFQSRNNLEQWSDFLLFAIWKEKDDGIEIEFKSFR